MALTRTQLDDWIADYERAWRTAGTAALAELFTPDATYQTAPFEDRFRGLGAITQMWEAERDGPDEVFTLSYEIVAVEGDTGVVRLDVAYGEPTSVFYRDMWIVRIDETGRCFQFEEWPFWPASADGGFAAGPG